jgi:hypothetical protein
MTRSTTWLLAGALTAAPVGMTLAQAPRDSLAFAGARGIYVWTGGTVVSRAHPVAGIVAHRVERRREGGRDWQRVADVAAVADAGAFAAGLDSTTRAGVRAVLGQATDAAAWEYIVRFPTADSLAGIIGDDRIRLALGIYALDPNVRPGERWQYRIADLGADGQARNARITTAVAYPSDVRFAPLITVATEASDSVVSVRWYIAPGHQGRFIEIWRRDGRDGAFRMVDSLGVLLRVSDSLQARYEDRLVRPGAQYQYFAVPRDLFANRGAASDTVTLYTVAFEALPLPDSLRVESVDSLGLVVRWRLATPERARSVRVYRAASPRGEWRAVGEVVPTVSRFVDPAPPVMEPTWYRLTLTSLRGDESPATAATFGYYRSPFPPAAPAGVQAEIVARGVRLTWPANTEPDLRGYVVSLTDAPAESLVVGAAPVHAVSPLLGPQDTTFVDSVSAFERGRAYAYVVETVNTSERRSDYSVPAVVTPAVLGPPPVPTGADGYPGRDGVRLHWDDQRAVDLALAGYLVTRRRVSAPPDAADVPLTAVPLGANDNGFTDTTARAGAVYEYRIRSVGLLGTTSEPTAPVRIAVPPRRPLPPGNARAAVTGAGVTINWDAVEAEGIVVRIYRYRRGQAPAAIAEMPAAQQTFTDRQAPAGSRYFYYLVSVRDGVESDRSAELSVRR